MILRRTGDGRLTISVEDDGVGWTGVGAVQGTGLGTKVMTAMAIQLQASLAYEPVARGTRAVFSLKA